MDGSPLRPLSNRALFECHRTSTDRRGACVLPVEEDAVPGADHRAGCDCRLRIVPGGQRGALRVRWTYSPLEPNPTGVISRPCVTPAGLRPGLGSAERQALGPATAGARRPILLRKVIPRSVVAPNTRGPGLQREPGPALPGRVPIIRTRPLGPLSDKLRAIIARSSLLELNEQLSNQALHANSQVRPVRIRHRLLHPCDVARL